MDQREFTDDALRRIDISVEHPARTWALTQGLEAPPARHIPHRLLVDWRDAGCPLPPVSHQSNGSWSNLLEKYLREKQVHGASRSSLRVWRYRLLAFVQAVEPMTPADVTRESVINYLAGNSHWKPEMQNQVRNTLYSFYAWACEAHLATQNPAFGLPRVRVPQRVPTPAPEPSIRDAINGARPDVRLMILLGALAGLRRAEIANLHTAWLTEYGMRVIGKGGRERMVPIHPVLRIEIDAYRARIDLADGYFFTWNGPRPLSPAHIGRLISNRLPPGVTTHKLRHRFAAKSYAGTYDIRAVQELLGHSSPATTARYIATPAESLVDAVAAVPTIAGITRT